MRRWLQPIAYWAVVSVVLNYTWEMAQVPFFSSMASAPLREHALRCLGSAAGDVLLGGFAYFLASLTARSFSWPGSARWVLPTSAWILFGLAVTVVIERVAVANGRWTYGEAMPTIFGVGLLPLFQWLVVPLITLAIWRALISRCSRTDCTRSQPVGTVR